MSAFLHLPPFILASRSPRRMELLRQIGLEFRVMPSDATELDSEHLTAREVALLNAHRKARAVAKKRPDALVLGADTVVALDQMLFGKPTDLADAQRMLQALQGHTHQVVTGVCLLHLRGHREKLFSATTLVTFRELSAAQIRRYLRAIDPLDKAGAYAIQERGDEIVQEISGSYSNVVGLPLEQLQHELQTW